MRRCYAETSEAHGSRGLFYPSSDPSVRWLRRGSRLHHDLTAHRARVAPAVLVRGGRRCPVSLPEVSTGSLGYLLASARANGQHPELPSLWHQTPEIVGVPNDEPWANGAAP